MHAVEFETRRQVIEGQSDRLCRADGLRLHGQQDACHGEQRRNHACEPDRARGNECRADAECATRRHGSAYLVRVCSLLIGEADDNHGCGAEMDTRKLIVPWQIPLMFP